MMATINELSQVRANQRTRSPLNVDVHPTSLRDNKVRTRVAIEYTPATPDKAEPGFDVRETVNVWLESGKPTVISRSADPLSDRRVVVEVTATVIR
jgi:hypothetical protein